MIENNYFDAVFKALPSPSVLLRVEASHYTVIAVNSAYFKYLGIEEFQISEMSLTKISKHIPKDIEFKDVLEKIEKSFFKVTVTGETDSFRTEVKFNYQKSANTHISIKNIPFKDPEGNVKYILHTIKDTTEKELAKIKIENLNHRFEDLITSIEGIFWEADASTFEFTYISPQVKSILGYTQEEWLSQKDFWQRHLHKDDLEDAVCYCHEQTLLNQNHSFEYRIHKANGQVIWVRDVVSVITKHGKPTILRGIILDINQIKLLELEKQEISQKLAERNAFIETVVNNIPIGIAVTNPVDNSLSVFNNQFSNICEWDKETIETGDFFNKIIANPAIAKEISEGLSCVNLKQNSDVKIWQNLNIETQNKNTKTVTIRNIPVPNQNITITTLRDTTEATKNYKELEDTKNKLSRIMEHSVDMICTMDENGVFTQVSKVCYSLLGYHAEELIGRTYIDFVEDSHKKVTEEVALSLRDCIEIKNFENYYVKKDGSTVPLTWSVKWLEEEKQYYCICKDATEKIAYETEILNSERNYKNLFENNPTPMFIWDTQTLNILDCNEEALLLYGYSKEEFLSISIKALRPKEEIPLLEETMKRDARFGKIHKGVWRDVKKNGDLIYVSISGHIIDYKGKKCALVAAIDITERIELEELQKFERRDKEALINNTEDLIWSVDCNYSLVAANTIFLNRIKHHTNKDLKRGDYILDEKLFPAESTAMWRKLYANAFQGQTYKEVISAQTSTNKTEWVETSFYPIKEGKDIVGVACRTTNITQQKVAEERIKKSEANLAEAQKLTKLGSWEIDLDTQTITLSKELYNILDIKYSDQEISSDFILDLVDDEFKAIKKEIYKKVLVEGNAFSLEYTITTPKGNQKTIQEYGYGKKNSAGVINKLFGTAQDVTKIKNLEAKHKELLEKQQLLYAIVSSSEDAIISKTLDGYITSWNKGAEIIFGYSEEEVLNQHISIIIPKSLLHEKTDIMRSVMNGKHIHNFETLRRNKNGKEIDVSLTVSPITGDNKDIIGISIIARNIRDKKKAEKDLLDAYNEKNSILESIGDAFFTLDHDLRITYWNKVAARELNTPKEDILGKKLFVEVFQHYANSLGAEKFKNALVSQKNISYSNFDIVTQKHFDVSIYPSEKGLSGYFRNTTTERRTQQQFEAVVKNMPGITYRCKVDEKWSMIFLSDGVKEITGYEASDLIENQVRSFASIIHPGDVSGTHEIEKKIRKKEVFHIEYRIICKNEKIIWVEDIGRGVYNSNDELEYIDGVILDITQRKLNEVKLQKLNKELKTKAIKLAATNNELEQFAYVASHDLQEPLRMVSSFLTLLKNKYENTLGEEGDKYIYYAVDGAQRMRKIILDLLEFSKIGKTKNNKESINLNHIIDNICLLNTDQIKQLNAKIAFAKLPTIINFRSPIQQIFSNLISNSLKYGAKNISVSYKENKKYWQFAVKDDGIGINSIYFEKIFIIFQRLHNKDTYSGTGIGLAITKKIVENLGGKIWVESEEGKGSVFYFTILKHV